MSTDNRCSWSDLPPYMCAHCRGDRGVDVEPVTRPSDPAPAVSVWPKPDPAGTPGPVDLADSHRPSDPVSAVSADLASMLDMAALLGERGADLGDNPEMPGGDAMVNLAGVASLAEWEAHQEERERQALLTDAYASTEDEDPDEHWPPFQMLWFWSEEWRRELGMNYTEVREGVAWRPSITSEARFLRNPDVLAWAWDNELQWDDFVKDVGKAKTKLENIVRSGERVTRSRIMCNRDHPSKPHKRLILIYNDEPEQTFKAPCCHATFTAGEAQRAHAQQMRSEGAKRWVSVSQAIDLLKAQGWQERTARRWINPIRHASDRCMSCRQTWEAGKYRECPALVRGLLCAGTLEPVFRGDRDVVPESYCEPGSHKVFVWWPDLWRRHLAERHKRDTVKAQEAG